MKIIEPNVTEVRDFEGVDNFYKAVARAARICYASNKTTDDKKLVERLIESKHFSPFAHSVIYIPLYGKIRELKNSLQINFGTDFMKQLIVRIQESNYVVSVYNPNRQHYEIAINGRIIIETLISLYDTNKFFSSHIEALDFALANLKDYEMNKHNFKSFIVDTSIGCTREMNRHHDNFYVCEQSTRYVNFAKDKFGGEISINKPYWFDNEEDYNKTFPYWNYSIQVAEKQYLDALKAGVPTDIARGILPLDTHTRTLYTSTIGEWQHIIDLRLKGTTGKPHGDIMIIANKINEILCTEK